MKLKQICVDFGFGICWPACRGDVIGLGRINHISIDERQPPVVRGSSVAAVVVDERHHSGWLGLSLLLVLTKIIRLLVGY